MLTMVGYCDFLYTAGLAGVLGVCVNLNELGNEIQLRKDKVS